MAELPPIDANTEEPTTNDTPQQTEEKMVEPTQETTKDNKLENWQIVLIAIAVFLAFALGYSIYKYYQKKSSGNIVKGTPYDENETWPGIVSAAQFYPALPTRQFRIKPLQGVIAANQRAESSEI